ncbi:hypothetical protein QYE76_005461 [Lolium multiflorum]|uniref:DUF4283 domain-containing protein n=1 Tax=Lolium multiflorum TaxID=4521 RepID=A0AAD8RSQ3_LOLMU|nr:hypothetical protein QYE76_005461 [Lolium multiflorum]
MGSSGKRRRRRRQSVRRWYYQCNNRMSWCRLEWLLPKASSCLKATRRIAPIDTVKPKKPIWCWKCSVDSHAVKDSGVGTYETFFTTLPDSVVKDDLVPNSSPVARVVVTGEAVTTVVIQKQMARRCPAKSQWKWEAVPHGDNEFLISFPSFEDLDVVDGIQMAVPGFNSQMFVSVWKPTDVPHKFELEQVWLHVEGVPHNVRHFGGLWAVGSLMGKTLDVDLLSLRCRGVIRVPVAMFDTTKFGKKDAATFVKSDVVVKLKGYEFRFSRESPSYVPGADFVPFVWRKKDGDGDGGKGKEHEDAMDISEFAQGTSDTVMHQAQGSSSSTAAPAGSSQVAAVLHAVTPYNSDPKTPRGIALVAALRKSHPSLERRSPTALVGSDMQPPISLVDGHFSSKAVAAEELSVALSSVSSPSQRLVVQDVALEALAKKVQVTPSTSRGRRNVLGRTRPSPPLGDAALASHPTHGPGGGQLLPAHAGVDGGEQQITAVGEQQLTVAGEQRLKYVSEYVGEKQLTCTGKQQLTSMCEHALKYVGEKQFTSAPLEHGQRVAGAAPAGCDGEQQPRLAAGQTERHGPARGCVGEQQLLLTADQPVSRGPASGVSLPAAVADRMLRLEVVVSREGKGGSSEAVAAVGLEPTVAAVAPSSPATDTSPTSNVDTNNVPLASLVAQEENVDVNFIKNNNFNNNAYRNNSGNNYRPYPSAHGNGYGNSYGNSYNNNRSVPPGLEAMLKEFISTQTAFNKSVEERLDKIDIIASRVDRLASDVDLLKLKVMPNEDIDNKITTTANAIQVRINENIRLMAELRARWDREENEKLAKENNVAKVWTITTISNDNDSHVAAPPTINGKIIGVGNVSTPSAKRTKLPEIAKTAETACDKTAEIFSNLGDNDPIAVAHNDLDFDDCHISEVIKFLQKLAKSPNASAINLAFTKHITNALIKAREEKLKLETSIPRKNPSKEIFSELVEINARVLFLHEASKTEREKKWGHEVATHQGGRPGRAALVCGPLVTPPDLPFCLQKVLSHPIHDAKFSDGDHWEGVYSDLAFPGGHSSSSTATRHAVSPQHAASDDYGCGGGLGRGFVVQGYEAHGSL